MLIFSLFSSASKNGSGSSPKNDPPQTTVISEGASIQGLFELGTVNLRIAGHVQGDIVTEGRVVVAEKARVEGTIEAQSIRLEGYAEGDVYAEEEIVLCPSSEVHATLDADVLEIKPGADFIGSVAGDESAEDLTTSSSSDLGSMGLVRVPSTPQGGDGAVAQ